MRPSVWRRRRPWRQEPIRGRKSCLIRRCRQAPRSCLAKSARVAGASMGRGTVSQGFREASLPRCQLLPAPLARRFFRPRKEKPLVGIGAELFVTEDAIALALSFPLEWQGYQVAESAFRNSRLSWEHAVVGIELDRFGAPHCFGDECASEVAGKLRAYGPLEEEPDMATVSRS